MVRCVRLGRLSFPWRGSAAGKPYRWSLTTHCGTLYNISVPYLFVWVLYHTTKSSDPCKTVRKPRNHGTTVKINLQTPCGAYGDISPAIVWYKWTRPTWIVWKSNRSATATRDRPFIACLRLMDTDTSVRGGMLFILFVLLIAQWCGACASIPANIGRKTKWNRYCSVFSIQE